MIKIGTSIQLERQHEETGEKEHYRSRIIEIEEDKLYIDYPINIKTDRTNIFPKGTPFFISLIGKDESVYTFMTEIMGKKHNKVPMLILDFKDKELTRIQRRAYVRVPASLDIAIHSENQAFLPFTSLTQDISGGGLSVLVDKKFESDQKEPLQLMVVLPMDNTFHYLKIKGEVVRVHLKENSVKNTLSVKFLDIQDRDRQLIVRYCYLLQLKERRKGIR
ncbi:flagellar brake protein [Saliterribacillus persicus]|uniref:flagellar brake protein n=1 Tax=Saliterribacillus persicus TaxID=930114 RepID=UPI0014741D85|nr:flagellar brake domain-containing protein [Saliterribacillus persicus]